MTGEPSEGPTGAAEAWPASDQAPESPEPGAAGESATGGWTVLPGASLPAVDRARPSPWRWWVAIAVTVLVVGSVAGAVVVATRGAGASPTLGYVPSNAIVYAEGRLDVPGDQGVALASFLSNFPGFSDTSNLQAKLDDTWDRLFAAIPGNPLTYSADVAPWVQGTIAVAVLPGATPSAPRAVALVAVANQDRAQAELDKLVTAARSAGVSPAETTIGAAPVWTFPPTARAPGASSGATAAPRERGVSVALLPGAFVAASDPATIGTLQDVKAGRAAGLEGSQPYRDATSGTAASDLAAVYVSTGALGQELQALVPSIAPAPSPLASPLSSPLVACVTRAFPVSAYGTLRAESDRLVADLRAQAPSGSATGTARTSTLVDHVPGTALVYLETHDAGATLVCLLTQVTAVLPATASGSSVRLGQVEGLLGGRLESLVSWMGDAGIVVDAPTGASRVPRVALLASVPDAALAAERLGQLHALIGLATLGGAQGITLTETSHGSATITTVSIAASSLSLPGVTGGAGGAPTSIALSWTLSNGRFILGLGQDEVAALLDQASAQSLGATPAFTDALASAGGPATTGFAYVDLRALRAAAESAMPATERSAYDASVRPYLLPFDRLMVVNSANGSATISRAIITVSNPQ